MPELAAFVGVAAVVIVTPGPDTALTIRNTLQGNRRTGCATAVGVCGGQLIWAATAAGGLAAVLEASTTAYRVVRLAGAAYLLLLGLRALRHAVWPAEPERSAAPAMLGAGAALRQGLLSNLSNPKMVPFFTGLLPQFTVTGQGGSAFYAMLALGLVFSAMTLCWLCAYAAAADRAGRFLSRRATRRALDAACALTFIGLSLRIAVDGVR